MNGRFKNKNNNTDRKQSSINIKEKYYGRETTFKFSNYRAYRPWKINPYRAINV
jgi:hypothetical protein